MPKKKSNTPTFKSDKSAKKGALAKLQIQKTEIAKLTETITELVSKAEQSGIKATLAKAVVTLY